MFFFWGKLYMVYQWFFPYVVGGIPMIKKLVRSSFHKDYTKEVTPRPQKVAQFGFCPMVPIFFKCFNMF